MEIRNMEMEDIPAYTDLYNLAEAHDPEFIRKTPEEMEKSIFQKSTDTLDGYFVAIEPGRMVAGGGGFVTLDKAGVGRGHLNFYVLPDFLCSEAEKETFDKIAMTLKEMGASTLGTRADTSNVLKASMLERRGFRPNAYQRHHMERSPHGVPEPVLPSGYKLRNARMPEEMPLLLETLNEAFATRENIGVHTLDEISKFTYLFDPDFLPGLFVAERKSDGRIVGWIGSRIEHAYNLEHGRKRGGSYSLVVIPSARGKGIGRALMQSSLRWLANKGMETAYLSVNHQNPDALHLYKSLGYELVGIWQGYELEL
jgi:ribosomal protein S18 acetylase RimI-like enzyme